MYKIANDSDGTIIATLNVQYGRNKLCSRGGGVIIEAFDLEIKLIHH